LILRTLKDQDERLRDFAAVVGAGREAKPFFTGLADGGRFGEPEVFALPLFAMDPVAQRAAIPVDHHQIAARFQRPPDSSKHLPWLGEVMVHEPHIGQIDGAARQSRIVVPPQHRTEVRALQNRPAQGDNDLDNLTPTEP
jgi:hypothetical protein